MSSEGGGSLAVRAGRRLRDAAYRAVSPIDALLHLGRRRPFPPLHLRRHVGDVRFAPDGPAAEFAGHLRKLAGLRDGDALWDLGCGCGLLALALRDAGWTGRYVGTDIHRPSVDWARRKILLDGHRFLHMDVRNAAYWPRGTLRAGEWAGTFVERDFDVAIAKSFFTHVLPDERDVYLAAIADRLKSGGRALLTFFVLPEAPVGRPEIEFRPDAIDGGARCSVRTPLAPTAAVAYERGDVLASLERAGFDRARVAIHPGSWSGRDGALSFQDVVLAER